MSGRAPLRRAELEIYASHSQFYVVDPEADTRGEIWDGAGLERHLGVADGMVAVGTIGHTFLPVAVEIWAAEPPLDEGWDHVAEAGLEVRSGRLGLAGVEGLAASDPLEVAPGTYCVRVSGAGLEGADELDGGDRWRVQAWPAEAAAPRVVRWWPPWDPAGAEPQRTTGIGRLLLGAEAADARVRMQWLASRGVAHLFRDGEGVLWEHSSLPDAAGTPQLEELDAEEAERRYGDASSWGAITGRPSGNWIKSFWDTWRYSRGRRPDPDPPAPIVEHGRRVYVGDTAVSRLCALRWLRADGGDGLYADDADGTLWEYRNADAASGRPRLRELSLPEARERYGIET